MVGKRKFYNITDDNLKTIQDWAAFRQSLGKADNTIKGEIKHFRKVADFLGDKGLKDATEVDLQAFFRNIYNLRSRDLIGTLLIQFYRWVYKTKRKERPPNMEWFEHSTARQRRKVKDPDVKKHLITKEEYNEILNASRDELGMWKALWQTMHLSGGRDDEIAKMRYKDVKIEGNNVIIKLVNSKTIPREVPLPDIPDHLIRWLENHPFTDHKSQWYKNQGAPLWVCLSPVIKDYLQPLKGYSIINKFTKIKRTADIKKTLTPHCFRKTRATMMFSARTKDGGIKYDDKQIGMFFGWTLATVAKRREEYDLRNFEDLKKTIFSDTEGKVLTYDVVKKQRDTVIEKQQKEIADLKNELKKKAEIDNFIMDSLSLIAKEMIQKQGVESIKEIFRKHNVPLAGD